MSLGIALKGFFKLLFDPDAAAKLQAISGTEPAVAPAAMEEKREQPPVQKKSTRSDAISLLSVLQREARFLDIVQEPLESFSDEQVGAAARNVLSDVAKTLDRMFGIVALSNTQEGESLSTPETVDPSQFRLIGNVQGEAPFRGTVVHAGWKAQRCELPDWSGSEESVMTLAPVELEIS